LIVGADHDVFGLEVAMYNAVAMNVSKSFADTYGDADSALCRQLSPFAEDLSKEAPFDPLHDHVELATGLVVVDLHYSRVVERLADGFLTMEAVKENGVHLHFGVRDFYGDLAAVTDVGSAKDRSHAATGDYGFNLVVIELFAGADGIPRKAASSNVIAAEY
jgi:hypothetical protein